MVYKDSSYPSKYIQDLKQHAIDSIVSGKILDKKKWNVFCNQIKCRAKKYPFSENFTNEIMFDMMVGGCYYCGNLATTIDRIDSTLDHTLCNCVSSCWGCNVSKGASDPATFMRKAYYRARGEYIDGINDIWFINKTKPSLFQYKTHAEKKEVPFDLIKEDFNRLVKGSCEYCQRNPSTWFGIDRAVPGSGYVLGNVFTCCFDCNIDKHIVDYEMTKKRNERIADRIESGVIVIVDGNHTTLHKGIHRSTKKVCAYGKVYASQNEASRALGKIDNYVCECIKYGRHSNEIFEISDEFYEKYKDCDSCK